VAWRELHADARSMAVGLVAAGIGCGDHVGILGPTTRNLVTAIEAVWLSGATVVVLPLPMRVASIDEFIAGTRRRIHDADVSLVVIDEELAPFFTPEPDDPPVCGFADLAGDGGAWRAPAVEPGDLAILQFTSGSTSDPKGVMLPHAAVLANVDGLTSAIGLDPARDVAVSWLPLYHDMGLVGILVSSMVTGTDLVLAGPQTFLANPSRWMQWLSTYGGTVTAGPNFSWVLAARSLDRLEGLDLAPVRVALNGAEPVDPDTVGRLVDAGARHGLRAGAVFPAFGMAEIAIAGTFPEPLAGLRADVVDGRVLETERYAAPVPEGTDGARSLARLGRAIPGLELRVVDPDSGDVRRDREVGELQIRGTSVMRGYYRRPEATAAAFDDGWLRTGDLAYLIDGELVVCGRIKDVIIVAGRNLFPEDIERGVGDLDGVRAGNVIAFGVPNRRGEGVVVVAEARGADHAALHDQVSARVRAVVGLSPAEVVLVQPGTLPKTSSGKLQRSLCRDRYLKQDLQPV